MAIFPEVLVGDVIGGKEAGAFMPSFINGLLSLAVVRPSGWPASLLGLIIGFALNGTT